MKTRPLLNSSEHKTLRTLEKAFRGAPCAVKTMVRMQAVIQEEPGDCLDHDHKQTLRTGEFDFVVYSDARAYSPLFAVEFDGPHHKYDPQQVRRDIRKNYMCNLANLPLIRITDVELVDLDKYSILEFIIFRYLAWNRSHQQINEEIEEYLDSLSDEQKESLTEGGIADPSIDSSFLFDIRHPFPRTAEVARRLYLKHGILSHRIQPVLKTFKGRKPCNLYCEVWSYCQSQSDGHDLVSTCDYSTYRTNKPLTGMQDVSVDKNDPSVTQLTKGVARLRVRCTLPIVYDYDPHEPPINYYLRHHRMPISFQQLPGVTAFNIADNVSEYLGYREVEKWASQQ